MEEKRPMSPISAAVSTTPRRQPEAQMKIWWDSGTSMPVWTMFQVPRQGGEYSSPCGKGAGKAASRACSMGEAGTLSNPGAGEIRLSKGVTSVH